MENVASVPAWWMRNVMVICCFSLSANFENVEENQEAATFGLRSVSQSVVSLSLSSKEARLGVSLPSQNSGAHALGCAPGFSKPMRQFLTVKSTTKLCRLATKHSKPVFPCWLVTFSSLFLLLSHPITLSITMTVGTLPGLPLTCLKTADFKSTEDVMKGKPTIIGKLCWTFKIH
jgi:hypothetical protein